MGKGSHHHLLAHYSVEIAARKILALSDEAERLRSIELLPTRREVGTGQRFVDGIVEADLDSAEGVGDQREAQQPDLRVVVHGDAGEIGDGLDEGVAAGFDGDRLRLQRIHALVLDELLHPVQSDFAVDAVDLRLTESRSLDVGVARDGDRGG